MTTVNPIDASRSINVFCLNSDKSAKTQIFLKEIVVNSFGKRENIVTSRMAKLFPGSTMPVGDAYALDSLVRGYMKLLTRQDSSKNSVKTVENGKNLENIGNFTESSTILSQRLSNGLFSIIRRNRLERKIKPIVSLTFAASGVQRHILSMTEQLHSSEIERKSLRATEMKLREQIVKQRHAMEMNSSKTIEHSYSM